jgi:hypothetical protein
MLSNSLSPCPDVFDGVNHRERWLPGQRFRVAGVD